MVRRMDQRTRSCSPWADRKGVKCLLHSILVTLEPPFGSENFHIFAPDIDIPMDGVAGHAKDRTFDKVLTRHSQAALWSDAGKANAGSGVDTESLVDASIEIRKEFDLISGCDNIVFRSEVVIQFLLKFRLDAGIAGNVIDNSGD